MRVHELSKNHAQWLRRLHQKKYRGEEQCFIAEGFNSLSAALESGLYPLREIIACREHEKAVLNQTPHGVPVYLCARSTFDHLSSEETPQGVIAVCGEKDFLLQSIKKCSDDIMLYLDRVSDPGNLGAIIRSAAWFGVRKILLSPSCVDPFGTKVIRASAGTLFNVEIYRAVESALLFEFAHRVKCRTIAAIPHGGTPVHLLPLGKKNIVLLGHERDGLSAETLAGADFETSIPGAGVADSLNLAIAASIILYEMSKKK